MKALSTSIVLMAALLTTGGAWAGAVVVDIPELQQPLISAPANQILTFSDAWVGLLNTAHVTVTPQAPATADMAAITSPIQSFSATLIPPGNGLARITGSTSLGGFLLTAAPDGVANTGGSLAIDNIATDLGTQTIYADLIGGNGVGTHQRQAIGHYAAMSGSAPMLDLPFLQSTCPGGCSAYVMTGLTLDADALTLLSRSLGLTSEGQAALAAVPDLGTLTTVIGVVPEPSTIALMGIGLLGFGILGRRRRQAARSC